MMYSEFSLPPVSPDAAGVEQNKAPVPVSGTARLVGSAKSETARVNPPPELDLPDLKQILQAGSKIFQQNQQHLSFSVDDASGRMVVSVIDSKTSEVIRQIPSEELLGISRTIRLLAEENAMAAGAFLFERTV